MDNREQQGWLALVATPIGNLDDTTFRAVQTLKDADLIAAEDTRRASVLCRHFDVDTQRTSYHAYNEHRKTDALLDQIEAGKKVAVLSDAGTPAVSDPGFFIVRAALQRGLEPVIVPGVSALTFAVVACGLPVDKFSFLGFPPVKAGKRRKFVEQLGEEDKTVFVFESPHRITRLLNDIAEVIGPETEVALIREATKMHEETIRGCAAELAGKYADKKWRGEFVLAVNARS